MKKKVSIDFFQIIKKKVLELEQELKTLQRESREKLVEGDKSKPELDLEAQLQTTLRQAKMILKECEPVPNPVHSDFVQIGSLVEFSFENNGKKVMRVEGVGGFADTCSTESPLGCQIIGARKEQTFLVNNRKVMLTNIF